MRLHHLHLPLLAALLSPFVSADVGVKFLTPAAGATLTAGSTVAITFENAGESPTISQLTSYQIFLMSGSNTNPWQLEALVSTGTFSTGNAATGIAIQPGLASSIKNGFFLKMISVATEGGTVINYSDRFSISGMTGTTPTTYSSGITGDTAAPATENDVSNSADTTAAAGNAGEATVPYNLQTGLTKYAPMQPIPPTQITAKSVTPLFPTSAYTIATTYLANPSIVTTVTVSQTFSVVSMENTVCSCL